MTTQIIPGIHLPRSVTRRDILRFSLAGAGIVALGPLTNLLPRATGAPRSLKRMVIVNCFGGNDTLNMFVPITLSKYTERRTNAANGQTIALTSAQCLPLGGPAATSDYMLHPSMPNTQALWNAGQVAAVNRVGYPTPNLSHFTSMDIYSKGVRGSFAPLGVPESGWLARFCDAHAPTPLGAVSIGVGRPLDLVGGTSNPLQVSSLSSFKILGAGANGSQYTPAHYHRLGNAREAIDRFGGVGRTQSQKDALADAHELVDSIQGALTGYASTVVYANEGISRQMKDIAMLVQAGFETRIFYTGMGGYDTHDGQGTVDVARGQPRLLKQLDNALGSFAADMQAMGTWNDTVVLVITEFGRRNYLNGSIGTDHGHAWTGLVLGGAVRGGVHGPQLTDADLSLEYPTYAVDFRSIYKELLDRHMNADPAPVFPEALQTETTLGLV